MERSPSIDSFIRTRNLLDKYEEMDIDDSYEAIKAAKNLLENNGYKEQSTAGQIMEALCDDLGDVVPPELRYRL